MLRRLAACRTQALGGQVTRCRHCAEVTYHYHSCGDRHCPQCGGAKRAAWLAKCRDLLGAAAEQEKATPAEPPQATPRGTPWGLYLLLALLPLGMLPGPLPSAALLSLMLASSLDTAALRALCPRCGSAQQETIWQAPRPNRRELEASWRWDTS